MNGFEDFRRRVLTCADCMIEEERLQRENTITARRIDALIHQAHEERRAVYWTASQVVTLTTIPAAKEGIA